MKKWNLEENEFIDKIKFKVHQPGQGIIYELKDEPMVRLRDARNKTFINK
jgi:hypothetical protein